MVIGIIAIVLQMISYEPDLRRSGAILATLVVTVVMAIISLYVAGILGKIVRNKKLFLTIKIITLILTGGVVTYTLLGIFTIGVFYLFGITAKVEVYNDVAEYDKFFNNTKSEKYGVTSAEMFDVFPEKITADMDIREFQYMYYNPFDAQYITYMTVALDEEAYQKELDRLSAIGTEEYQGIYSVTDEPQGYDLVAIDSDEYSGFVYAMVPEGANGKREITYVGISFCNYFLDIDIHNYLPDQYLLEGFDATVENSYRDEMLSKHSADN